MWLANTGPSFVAPVKANVGIGNNEGKQKQALLFSSNSKLEVDRPTDFSPLNKTKKESSYVKVVALPEVRSLGKHLRIKCTESLARLRERLASARPKPRRSWKACLLLSWSWAKQRLSRCLGQEGPLCLQSTVRSQNPTQRR